MKKYFVLVLLGLFACSLAFAGGGQEQPKAGSGPAMSAAGPKTPIQEALPNFTFPTEKITLNYWHLLGSRAGFQAWLEKTVSEYTAIHPNVTIKIRDVPIQEYQTLFVAASEAGTMPDVFDQFMMMVNAWGNVQTAPDWVTKLIEEKYTDGAKGWMKFKGSRKEYDGKYLGWMIGELDASQMLYYNKRMYRDAGLGNPPKTGPELVDAMKKTVKYDANGKITQGGWAIRYAGGPGGVTDKWKVFLFMFRDPQRGLMYNEDWSDIAAWDTEDFLKGVQLYNDMVWNWRVAAVDMPAPAEAFKLEMAAMTNREAFLYGALKKDAPQVEFGISPLVVGAGQYGSFKPGVWMTAQINLVSKTTKYPEVAWDFNMFMNTDERDLELSQLTGSYPRRKANENTSYAQNIPWKDVFLEMYSRPMQRDESLDPYGLFSQLQDILGAAVQKVITIKGTDIKKELQAANAKAREALKTAKQK